MGDLFFKKMSVVLKISCAIAIIAIAGSVEASAAKKTTKTKAKTTKVKKVKKQRKSRESQKVTELRIVEDDRVVASVDEDRGTDDITKDVVEKDEWVVVPIESKKEELKKDEPRPENEPIYRFVAHMPSFPGGDAALKTYLSKNIHYPQIAQDNGIQGQVIIQMVILKNGRIGEVKVVRSVDKDLDREAIRVCKSLPAFSPGRNANGDAVNVWYTLPVAFKLQGVD